MKRKTNYIAGRINAIGREVKATPMEIKAALETGIVESDLKNLPGGDADSAGWRQERKSLYKNPTNVEASIRRFFKETRAVRGKYGSAGDLAAAVQRPAAQYRGRYGQVSAQADSLMGRTAPPTIGSTIERTSAPDTTVDDAIVDSMMSGGKRHSSLFQDVIRRVEMAPPTVDTQSEKPATLKDSDHPAITGGSVTVAPTANRKGVNLKPDVTSFASQIASLAGPITIGTGTNHSQMTTSGNQSDHWTGDGMDLPATGKKGDKIAEAAFIAAGVPAKKARLWAQNGGLYNITKGGKRYQIIWKTNEGGNHFNHVHVGIRPSK